MSTGKNTFPACKALIYTNIHELTSELRTVHVHAILITVARQAFAW